MGTAKINQEGQTKIGTFTSNDSFFCKTFTSVFQRNINSKQILKLQQVVTDQS